MSRQIRSEWEKGFIDRTRDFRVRAGYEQQQMAVLLGAGMEAYRKYETRSCLPHCYVLQFCVACKISLSELYAEKPHRKRRNR